MQHTLERTTPTCSCPASGNHDNTGRWSASTWGSVCGREACCVGVGVEGQTVTFAVGQPQQSQIVTSALTLELPVNHHLLRGDGLLRSADTHHVPGRVAAKPGAERREERGWGGEKEADLYSQMSQVTTIGFTCWHSMPTSEPSRGWSECRCREGRHLCLETEATPTPATATWSWRRTRHKSQSHNSSSLLFRLKAVFVFFLFLSSRQPHAANWQYTSTSVHFERNCHGKKNTLSSVHGRKRTCTDVLRSWCWKKKRKRGKMRRLLSATSAGGLKIHHELNVAH